MKRTDQERIERELRRREKQTKVAERREQNGEKVSPGSYIKDLHALLKFDEYQIYNTTDDEDVLELLENMKEDLDEKHWDAVLKGAIRRTKVVEKDTAFLELKSLLTN